MKSIALIVGDTQSHSRESSTQLAKQAFMNALAPIANVHVFSCRDGLEDYWERAKTFDSTIPLLYPLHDDESSILHELDQRKITHLFSPFTVQQLLVDRLAFKHALCKTGIRSPEFSEVKNGNANLGLPLVLYALSRPAVGVWFAFEKGDLSRYLPVIHEYSTQVLAEALPNGERYCVSVIEDAAQGTRALPVVHLRDIPDGERQHYDDPRVQELSPADIRPSLRQALQDEAIRAHKALGFRHFSHSYFQADRNAHFWLTDITHSLVGGDVLYHECDAALRAAGIAFVNCVRLWLDEQ